MNACVDQVGPSGDAGGRVSRCREGLAGSLDLSVTSESFSAFGPLPPAPQRRRVGLSGEV
jgi:hypothetical protein